MNWKDKSWAVYPMNWIPPARGDNQGIFGYDWIGLVLFAVVVSRLFGLVLSFFCNLALTRKTIYES